jgi:hypothetical protein
MVNVDREWHRCRSIMMLTAPPPPLRVHCTWKSMCRSLKTACTHLHVFVETHVSRIHSGVSKSGSSLRLVNRSGIPCRSKLRILNAMLPASGPGGTCLDLLVLQVGCPCKRAVQHVKRHRYTLACVSLHPGPNIRSAYTCWTAQALSGTASQLENHQQMNGARMECSTLTNARICQNHKDCCTRWSVLVLCTHKYYQSTSLAAAACAASARPFNHKLHHKKICP